MWLPALLAAVGTGLLAYAVWTAALDLLRAGLGRRRRAVLQALRGHEEAATFSEEELYGLPRSLVPWMALAALAGLGATMALLDGPARVLGLAAGVTPILWKRRRLGQGRQEVRRQVAGLIEEMRLCLAFGGSLGPVLQALAAEERPEGIVYERLRAHRQLLALSGPEAALEQLAQDTRSPELQLLLRRVRAARRGGASYADALRAAADEVAQEIARQAETEVEGAPLRLMFPMIVLLLPPILALVLYPPAYLLITSLTGMGPGVLP
jgi:tight adherence protein C